MDNTWLRYTDTLSEEDEKEYLLEQIERAAKLAVPTFNADEATVGPVYLPGRFFLLRKRWLHLWRLEGLQEPLWLGSDGNIYRAYDKYGVSAAHLFAEGIRKIHHWQPAPIWNRKIRGLRRLLRVLTIDPEE